jgi:hypothetical protein
MALKNPFAAYNAANNVEAHLVRGALLAAGIEAHVTEDVSQVGTWMGGLIAEVHKPQVWIERDDIPRATLVLAEFERRAKELRAAESESREARVVEAVCEECGERSNFPLAHLGSVQECPHCGKYMDVGTLEELEETEAGDAAPNSSNQEA